MSESVSPHSYILCYPPCPLCSPLCSCELAPCSCPPSQLTPDMLPGLPAPLCCFERTVACSCPPRFMPLLLCAPAFLFPLSGERCVKLQVAVRRRGGRASGPGAPPRPQQFSKPVLPPTASNRGAGTTGAAPALCAPAQPPAQPVTMKLFLAISASISCGLGRHENCKAVSTGRRAYRRRHGRPLW